MQKSIKKGSCLNLFRQLLVICQRICRGGYYPPVQKGRVTQRADDIRPYQVSRILMIAIGMRIVFHHSQNE